MPEPQLFPQFAIKVGGTDVPEEFMDDVIEIVVDSSLWAPSMFTILLKDRDLKWVDDALLDIGKEVEISMEDVEAGGQAKPLMKGEITGWEPDLSSTGEHTVLVRGYDKSHRLHRGKQTRTFLNMTDSAIVQKVAGDAGLSVQVDATSATHSWVLQNNQTNMDFLLERADRIGYQVYSADGTLYFKKGTAPVVSGQVPELNLGEDLVRFQPRVSAAHQVDKAEAVGWDIKTKQAIVGQASSAADLGKGGLRSTGGATASSAFSSATVYLADQHAVDQSEAQTLAAAAWDALALDFVQADGECVGNPDVKAGRKVNIQGVGTRFSGGYYVTSATHIYNQQGYVTAFSISGKQPNSILHLVGGSNGRGADRHGGLTGVVVGLVTNLNDPDDLGRVKVKYPVLPKNQGSEIESDWVRFTAPSAGAQRGVYYLPEVNDEVLVAFEQGDVHRPFIVGALWNKTDKPPIAIGEAVKDGKVAQRVIKSRSGHIVILDDSDGAEKITIRDKTTKNEIIIDSSANSMTINVEGDFTINAKGKVTINSTKDLTLDSKAKGTISSQQDFSVDSKGKANIKALSGMDLNGTGSTKLQGAQVEVSGTGQTAVKSGGMVQIQGSLVKIN